MTRFVLGVDGGNTKTVAAVVDDSGCVHGVARTGCSDIYGAASASAALEELNRSIVGALDQAGVSAAQLTASAFSLAGADWAEDYDFLRVELRELGLAQRVSVFNDAFAPLRAGSSDFTGVACVCGTGAAIGARAPDGTVWHASWWLDTQGARQLGQRAVWAVLHAETGIGPPTGMTDALLSHFGAGNTASLLHSWTRRGSSGRWDTEAAAPILVRQAESGDPVAAAIARNHGRALGDHALAAARQAHISRLERLVLAGTVLDRSSVIADALVARVREEHADMTVVVPELIPAAGAVMLAMDRAGIPVTPSMQGELTRGLARPVPETL